MASGVLIDSFSGSAADLPRGQREHENVLAALRRDPRVSTWDMSEHRWLRLSIGDLERLGRVRARPNTQFPWLVYDVVDAADPLES